MLLATAFFVASIFTAHSTASVPDIVLSPEKHFGIFHFHVPGLLPVAAAAQQGGDVSDNGLPAIAHFFLRAFDAGDGSGDALVDGFLYYESVSTLDLFLGLLFAQPAALLLPDAGGAAEPPPLSQAYFTTFEYSSIKTRASNPPHTVAVQVAKAWDHSPPASASYLLQLPLLISARVPSQHVGNISLLHVEGWPRYASVGRFLRRGSLQPAYSSENALPHHHQQQQMRVYVVLHPFTRVSTDRAVYLLDAHVRWHRALGLDGHLVYDRLDGYHAAFTTDAALRSATSDGYLRFVSWSAADSGLTLPSMKRIPTRTLKTDQSIIYNHALLAHRGSGAHLLFIDFDEYLATATVPPAAAPPPPGAAHADYDAALVPGTMREVLGRPGCAGLGAAVAKIKRRDVFAESVLKEHEQQQQQLESSSVQDGAGVGAITEVAALWDSVRGISALREYRHISGHTDRQDKSLVMPDGCSAFKVHDGLARAGHQVQDVDPEACVFVAHLVHLFGWRFNNENSRYEEERYQGPDQYVPGSTFWHWPADHAAAAGKRQGI